ncbi:helix-turn-helix domain-containing protein [Amycolatopsis ultiminotia]
MPTGLVSPEIPDDGGNASLVEAFHDVASVAARQPGIERALRAAVANACELFGVDRCSVFLRGSHSRLFHGVAAETPGDRSIVHRMLCGVAPDLMSQEIVATGRPVLVRDAASDGRPVRSTMVSLQVKEVLGVPLMLRREVQGLLFLDLVGSHRGFDPVDTRRVCLYADLVAGLLPGLHRIHDLHGAIQDLRIRAHEATKAHSVLDDLARLSRRGTTPQEIATAAADAAGHECWVTDGAHRPIAHTGAHRDQGRIARALAHPATITALRSLSDDEVLDVPIASGATDSGGLVVAPISVQERRWGHVSFVCEGRQATSQDQAILLGAAHAIAVELRVEAGSAATTSEGRQQVARALIEGNLDTATRRRAALHSIPLDRHRVLCLVTQRHESSIRLEAHDIAQAFDAVHDGPPVLTTPTADGSVVVLVDLDSDTPAAVAARVRTLATAALRAADADDNLIAAVASPVRTADAIARAHTESERVMHCLRQLCPDSTRVLSADELGFACVLLPTIDRTGADLQVHRTLGGLLSDEPRDRELIHTADVFLRHARNVRDTARALTVHENTVRYRLGRIHDLTGLDLTGSADDQVSCQLALLILRLRGQLPPTEARDEHAVPA